MKTTDKFKLRRKSLERLSEQGILHCGKHDIEITKGRMYRSHCYIGRNRVSNQCPYLQFRNYETDEGCRK